MNYQHYNPHDINDEIYKKMERNMNLPKDKDSTNKNEYKKRFSYYPVKFNWKFWCFFCLSIALVRFSVWVWNDSTAAVQFGMAFILIFPLFVWCPFMLYYELIPLGIRYLEDNFKIYNKIVRIWQIRRFKIKKGYFRLKHNFKKNLFNFKCAFESWYSMQIRQPLVPFICWFRRIRNKIKMSKLFQEIKVIFQKIKESSFYKDDFFPTFYYLFCVVIFVFILASIILQIYCIVELLLFMKMHMLIFNCKNPIVVCISDSLWVMFCCLPVGLFFAFIFNHIRIRYNSQTKKRYFFSDNFKKMSWKTFFWDVYFAIIFPTKFIVFVYIFFLGAFSGLVSSEIVSFGGVITFEVTEWTPSMMYNALHNLCIIDPNFALEVAKIPTEVLADWIQQASRIETVIEKVHKNWKHYAEIAEKLANRTTLEIYGDWVKGMISAFCDAIGRLLYNKEGGWGRQSPSRLQKTLKEIAELKRRMRE